MTIETADPPAADDPAGSRAQPRRRGFSLSPGLRQSVITVLVDKVLLTLVLAAATYALQGYLDQNARMQETLRSSLATVTGVRSDFLKQHRNALAEDIVEAVGALDAGRAIGGLRDMRADVISRANRISEHFALLTSFVLNGLSVPDAKAPPSRLQLAVLDLQKANIALSGVIDDLRNKLDDLPRQYPGLGGDEAAAAQAGDGIMALVNVLAEGKGAMVAAFVKCLGALDKVTVEQVRVDVQDAISLAKGRLS